MLQTRLEAIDALEMVSKFNSTHSFEPMAQNVTPNLEIQLSKQSQGLYIPSSSEDEEDSQNVDKAPTRSLPPPLPTRPNKSNTKRNSPQKSKKSPSKSTPKKSNTVPEQLQEYQEVKYTFQLKKSLGLSLGDCVDNSIPFVPRSPNPKTHQSTVVVIAVEEHCPAKDVIQMGDILIKIGRKDCIGASFQKVLKLIRSEPRPLEIVFKRIQKVTVASPKSQAYVDQPGLMQSPPRGKEREIESITVTALLDQVEVKYE